MEVLDTIDELVDLQSTAVVVIDMQNRGLNNVSYEEPGFTSEGTEVENLRAVVPEIGRLLEAARAAKLFVAYAEWIDQSQAGVPLVNGPHLWGHLGEREPPKVMAGTWEAQTIDELAPQAGDYVFQKSWSNLFHHSGLVSVLRTRRVRSVILVGCLTGGCVLKSAVGASHHDFYPVIVRDCVASYNRETHELGMKWLEMKFLVFERAAVQAEWERDS